MDIKTFNYFTQEERWVKRGRHGYRPYRLKKNKGYIINNKDTIK